MYLLGQVEKGVYVSDFEDDPQMFFSMSTVSIHRLDHVLAQELAIVMKILWMLNYLLLTRTQH